MRDNMEFEMLAVLEMDADLEMLLVTEGLAVTHERQPGSPNSI